VAAELPTREAHIADDASESSTGYEYSMGVPPHFIQRIEKTFVILDMSELGRMIVVCLERPVRGRRHDEVNRLVRDPVQLPCVPSSQLDGDLEAAGSLDPLTLSAGETPTLDEVELLDLPSGP
jgi:hypothetical protein